MKTKNLDMLWDIKENYHKYPADYFSTKYKKSLTYIHSLASKMKATGKFSLNLVKEEIIKKYKSGVSLKILKKEFGRGAGTLKRLLQENNCLIRDPRASHVEFGIDESYFEKIDTHQKAYWLGFIYADGNVHQNKLQIGLAKKDRCLLDLFKKHIKSEHKIYEDRENPKFIVRSPKICEDLLKLGVTKKKSLTLLPPDGSMIPKEFLSSFILGYFDGDGCVGMYKSTNKHGYKTKVWKIQITSTLEFLKFLKAEIDKECDRKGGIYKEKRSENNTWNLVYGGGCASYKGKKTPEKIFKYLYRNMRPVLKRKYRIFKKICSKN